MIKEIILDHKQEYHHVEQRNARNLNDNKRWYLLSKNANNFQHLYPK